MGKFRGDIEGLRGVAVALVVAAHAGVPGFAGGYVGVDIFFVISGFLITGLLRDELAQGGSIAVWDFYARRMRRLLPALACMLVGVMLLAIVLVPAPLWATQADGMRWSALWASNLYFGMADFGYFAPAATENLFLHTWSLAVEEQFYLLWPVLLIVFWRWRGPAGLLKGIALIVALGFLASLVAASSWPVQAYYQTPFRLWQLASGALLQVALSSQPKLRGGAATRLAGLLLVLASAVFLAPERVAYPGAWALLPTLAAIALLLPPVDTDSANWLTAKPLRFLGRISYSWYLWHWPLLVLARDRFGADAGWLIWIVGIATLLPAWVSWRWIEVHRHGPGRGDPRRWVLSGVLVSGALMALASIWASKVPEPAQGPEQRLLSTLRLPALYDESGCDEWYSASRVVPCERVSGTGWRPPVIVLAGDSVAAQWSPAFEVVAKRHGWRLVVLTKSSCPMIDHPFVYARLKRRYVECETWRNGVVDYLRQLKPERLVIGSSSAYGDIFTLDDWTTGTDALLSRLAGSSPRIDVLAPTPLLSKDPVQCALRTLGEPEQACSFDLAAVRPDALIGAIAKGAAGHASVHMLDMSASVCPGARCTAVRAGVLSYRDSQHLNAAYVEALAPELERRLRLEAR